MKKKVPHRFLTPEILYMDSSRTTWRSLLTGSLLALVTACGGGPESAVSVLDTLADDAWPTESLSGEAGATKKVLLKSLEEGVLEAPAAGEIFADGFRGEDFTRSRETTRVQSGIVLAEWPAASAELDAEAFVERWNAYLAEFDEILSLEVHTWEIQLRAAGDGIETHEAVWLAGRLADGRMREDRLYLVLDLVKLADGEWKIAGVGSEDGRTTVAPGHFFRDVTAQVLPPGFDQIGAQIYTDGGPALADFDGDGDVDLFVPRLHASALLYRNDGNGYFDDVTALWGLALNALAEGSNSGLFVDFDNDRRLDLVIGLKRRGFLLLRNEGTRFRDVTGAEPLAGAGEWEALAAADYDGDGRVDLFAANYGLIDAEHQPESYVDARDGLPNVLLRNLGGEDGEVAFADVTAEAGLTSDRWTYAAAWADYDRDGDMDLFVANDYGPKGLYRNRGDGTFDEVAAAVGADDFGNGMGVTWADVDGDLWLDAYTSNMQSFAGNRITRLERFPGSEEERKLYRRFSRGNTLLRNQGDGTFTDHTDAAGVRGAFWAWGNLAFDYESDGDLDLFVCGGFYTGASAADT